MLNKNLVENAELIDVVKSEDKILFILVKDQYVYEIIFNYKKYDKLTKTWINSTEQEQNVAKWCLEYIGVDEEHLSEAIGKTYNIYKYPKFVSFWESESSKFDKLDVADKGKNITCFVENVTINDFAITFELRHNEKLYKSNMNYSMYISSRNERKIDEFKRAKQFTRFNNTYGEFGVYVNSVDDYDFEGLIGQKAKCEIRVLKNGSREIPFLQINAVI